MRRRTQTMAKKGKRISIRDEVVLYRSEQDRCWIAHSLRTDQIGAGQRVVEALADLIRAMRAVTELARDDDSVAYLRDAPAEVQAIAKRSATLPAEVFEVAHKMARSKEHTSE